MTTDRIQGLVMMTAMPPTLGHEHLIKMSMGFLKEKARCENSAFQLNIVLMSRSIEPIAGTLRFKILKDMILRFYSQDSVELKSVVIYHVRWDDAPQNILEYHGTDMSYWDYWASKLHEWTGIRHSDYLFASEPYGANMALAHGARFISIDANRDVVDVSGTQVRSLLAGSRQHQKIGQIETLPVETRQAFTHRYVLFGAESVGKTTIAKRLARDILTARFYPEWARQFLETTGYQCNSSSMDDISVGQFVQEELVMQDPPLVQILDTDVLSTVGYYMLSGIEDFAATADLISHAVKHSDRTTYLVLSNDVPFTPDPLRYGVDKRESDTELWTSLLDVLGMDYHVVTDSDYETRYDRCWDIVLQDMYDRYGKIEEFVRT